MSLRGGVFEGSFAQASLSVTVNKLPVACLSRFKDSGSSATSICLHAAVLPMLMIMS